MNITLIGMPGSGKSFVGKKLAQEIGFAFVELDTCMEDDYGLPLQKILDTLGEDEFLKKQAEDVILYTEGKDNVVISPGGSIVYTPQAMEYLQQISTIVYLQVPLETLIDRIGLVPRGIVGLGTKSLEQLYDERTVLYRKYATYTVDGDQDVDLVVSDIKMVLNEI